MKIEVGSHLELIVDELFGEDEFIIEDRVLILLHHVKEGKSANISHFLITKLEFATRSCLVILKRYAHEFFSFHKFFLIDFTNAD
jgi:hypothetical protein